MKHFNKILVLLMCFCNTAFSQTVITLNQPEVANGNVTHVANTSVNFQPNYHYSPLTATSIHAYIDESVTGNTPAGGVFSSGLGGGFDDRQINTGLEVGTISGSQSVSSSGAATYSIPIKLPPGTNGKAPSLSINYNSQQGNGLLGIGWSLGGLSVITRVPKTIYHNSIVEPVMIDNYTINSLTLSDDFALDGNRLITSGNYGADGTVYGTESETFNKITSKGITGNGPAWFKVETKDGLTLEYGNSPDSKMLPTVQKTSVMVWYLNKVTDNYGNVYNYTYRLENNEILIDKIEYGNAQETFNSIQFIYDSRQDNNTIHVATEPVNQNVVLSQIKISADGVLVRKYELKYGYSLYSYLTEIIEYGSDGSNLNSSIFKYGDLIDDVFEETVSASYLIPTNSNSSGHEFWASDFNGDGKSDLLGFSYGLAYLTPTPGQPSVERQWLDIDLFINNGNNQFTKTANIQLPNGFTNFDQFYPKRNGQIGNTSLQNIDFNGDGLSDILFIIPNGNYQILKPYLSNGTTLVEQPSIQISTAGGGILSRIFDADGDGKSDIFITYKTGPTSYKYELIFNLDPSDPKNCTRNYNAVTKTIRIYQTPRPLESDYPPPTVEYTSSGGQFTTPNPAYLAAVALWNNIWNGGQLPYIDQPTGGYALQYDFSKSYVMDLDGDGKYGLENVEENTVGVPPKKIAFEYNHTCLVTSHHNGILPWESISNATDQLFGDFNGDGKSDKMYTIPTYPWMGWRIRYTTSLSYVESIPTSNLLSPYGAHPDYVTLNLIHYVGDVNGDGKSDIIEFENSTTVNIHYSNGISFLKKSYSLTDEVIKGYDELTFGDFNGDGKSDILIRKGEWPYPVKIISFDENSKEMLLHGIKDGFNNTTEFTYDYLTNDDIYTKGSSSNYPLVDVQIPITVVTEVKTDNGVGGDNITSYRYEEARTYKKGRGLLGFKKTISENNTSNTRTLTEYGIDPTFITPYLKKINSALISPSQPLAETEYFYDYLPLGNKQFLVNTSQIIQKNLLNNFITTTNYSSYDNFGNVEVTTINKGGIETITINNSYESHGNWGANNKLASTITSATRTGSPAYVREITFDYNTEGSLITKIEDPSTTKEVTTSYQYDNGFGNVTKSTVTGSSVRINEFFYDAKGRFVTKTINSLGQQSSATYDNRWGVPLTQTGIDGLTTTYQYDGFGRLLKTITPDNIVTETTLAWEIGGGGASNPISADNSIYTSTTTSTQSPVNKVWYDSFGRPRKNEVDGFDQKINQVTTYDARGNVATTTTPFFAADAPKITTYSYNDYNLNNSIITAVSTTTINRNLSTGTTTTTLTPSNGIGSPITSTSVTDPTGKTISVTDAGGTLTYTYYSSGLQKDIKLDGVLVADMEYDIKGNQTKLTDANAGVTTYEYNPFGELTKQTDAKNNVYEMTYDLMGRIVTKKENGNANFTTNYEYYGVGDNGINQVKNITYNGITQHFTYDYLGRLIENKETIGADEYKFGYVYDTYNRLQQTTYPSGFTTKHNYNSLSYPTSVTDEQANPIWQVGSTNVMNAYNQYKTYALGNGQTTTKTYDDYGFLTSTSTSNPDIQHLVLNFNPANGNLMSRENPTKMLLEEFTYDNLNRLTETKVNGTVQISTLYQTNGNIGFKTDAGNYSYHVNKKNAVTQVNNPNGNINSNVQDITYTPFNSVNNIIENNKTLTFTYGPDQQRRKTQFLNNGILEKTNYYIGNYEKIVNEINGDVTELHYIAGGDGLAAIHVITTPITQPSTPTTFYTYTDHLGSILTLTDENATIVYEQNFDAWGRTRKVDDWTYDNVNINAEPFVEVGFESIKTWLYRGYTGHEHLSQFGLINMNGRLYDPMLGRMLSPDNYVQSPYNTQSYNRYSYVINNPLKYIDPSGENWWSDFWGGVSDAWNGFWDYLNGQYNPATGQYEGGIAQQIPDWVPNFGVGINSSGQTYHYVGNNGNVYHNNNGTIPGINWSEVYVANNNSVGGMPTTGLYGEPFSSNNYHSNFSQDNSWNGKSEVLTDALNNSMYNLEGLGIASGSAALSVGGNILYNNDTWRSLQYGRNYSQRFNGSQYVTDKLISRNIQRGLNIAGKGLGVYNAYNINQQYKSGQINDVQMFLEQGSNVFSTFGGLYGASWGLGWELGRTITTIPSYQQWKYEVWLPWRKQNFGY